jgi:hypothetical protein
VLETLLLTEAHHLLIQDHAQVQEDHLVEVDHPVVVDVLPEAVGDVEEVNRKKIIKNTYV